MPKEGAFSRKRLFTLKKRQKYTQNALKIKDTRINAARWEFIVTFSHWTIEDSIKARNPAVTSSRFCSLQEITFPTVVTGLSIPQ